jgi:hypothetical protein
MIARIATIIELSFAGCAAPPSAPANDGILQFFSLLGVLNAYFKWGIRPVFTHRPGTPWAPARWLGSGTVAARKTLVSLQTSFASNRPQQCGGAHQECD